MSSNEPVMQFLDKVIKDFKEEFQQANTTVEELCFLESHVMSRLMKANARAQAALATKAILINNEDDRVKVSKIKALMDKETKSGGYTVASLYEQVLSVLDKKPVF